eukprot:CAMPEP_0183457182 /NCGR_PEP_ID=MMETSP0370-20130417/130711_1 /TAXON_ID=268820 /ORGANISM="Peridinium aciculiferum, Strain PAER-2" /LENGTH=311 /DNA_ID=CAMNT_0025648891 /DNA_START=62 /DNA_END=994 /DNA_ORIENTATION=-
MGVAEPVQHLLLSALAGHGLKKCGDLLGIQIAQRRHRCCAPTQDNADGRGLQSRVEHPIDRLSYGAAAAQPLQQGAILVVTHLLGGARPRYCRTGRCTPAAARSRCAEVRLRNLNRPSSPSSRRARREAHAQAVLAQDLDDAPPSLRLENEHVQDGVPQALDARVWSTLPQGLEPVDISFSLLGVLRMLGHPSKAPFDTVWPTSHLDEVQGDTPDVSRKGIIIPVTAGCGVEHLRCAEGQRTATSRQLLLLAAQHGSKAEVDQAEDVAGVGHDEVSGFQILWQTIKVCKCDNATDIWQQNDLAKSLGKAEV